MTDNEIALGWLRTPPELPPSNNPLDDAYPSAFRYKSSLSDLVTTWKVSAADAERVFQSWAIARRRIRSFRLHGKRNPSTEPEVLADIRKAFWAGSECWHGQSRNPQPTSVALRQLSRIIHNWEQSGQIVSLEECRKILSEPLESLPKALVKWMTHHWFVPEKDSPPLCLCSDSLILEIADRSHASLVNGNQSVTGDALRQLIHDYGLWRPDEPKFSKGWLDRDP